VNAKILRVAITIAGPAQVDAELFIRRMTTGRNKALLVTARGGAGSVDCVVKLRGLVENPALEPLPCLCEWLAAALALHMGITTPTPYEVNISKAFAQSIGDAEIKTAALAIFRAAVLFHAVDG
jgi:hypothetical protein